MRIPVFIPIFLMIFALMSCAKEEKPQTEEEWLTKKCNRCHASSELKELFIEAKQMGQEEFEEKLHGMVHGSLKITDEEIPEILEIIKAYQPD